MDPYAYVAGNPETKNDPTGRVVPLIVGFAIGLGIIGVLEILAAAFLVGVAVVLIVALVIQWIESHPSSPAVEKAQSIVASTSSDVSWSPEEQRGLADSIKERVKAEKQKIIKDLETAGVTAAEVTKAVEKEKYEEANEAGAELKILDSSGHETQVPGTAFGFRGAKLSDHAEIQLYNWALGEIGANAGRDVIKIELMIWTAKRPCSASCGPLLQSHAWLIGLWNVLKKGLVFLHVWYGGIPGHERLAAQFKCYYSHGTGDGRTFTRKARGCSH